MEIVERIQYTRTHMNYTMCSNRHSLNSNCFVSMVTFELLFRGHDARNILVLLIPQSILK